MVPSPPVAGLAMAYRAVGAPTENRPGDAPGSGEMNGPSVALHGALALVTVVSFTLVVVGWRRQWRKLLVNASITSAFLGFFWVVTRFPDFEDSLSTTGEAILIGAAVAGIAEFANTVRVWFEGQGDQ